MNLTDYLPVLGKACCEGDRVAAQQLIDLLFDLGERDAALCLLFCHKKFDFSHGCAIAAICQDVPYQDWPNSDLHCWIDQHMGTGPYKGVATDWQIFLDNLANA